MERDDEQLMRHNTRELGAYLSILYHELRAEGVPKRVAEKITFRQWEIVVGTDQAETFAKKMLDAINGGEDDS